MEEHFSKINSEYLFYASWTDIKGTEKKIAVKLSINHRFRTFNIVAEQSSTGGFIFKDGNQSSSLMWYAVAEAIIKANTFARAELDFEETKNNKTVN